MHTHMPKLLVALLVSNALAFGVEIQKRTDEFPKEQMLTQNKHIVDLFVEEISKTLPQTIDKYTQLTEIKSKNVTLLYTFEIKTGAKSDEDIRKEDKTRMQKAVTRGVCQSSKRFLDAQINIAYIYINAVTKANLFQFDITNKDCKEFAQY